MLTNSCVFVLFSLQDGQKFGSSKAFFQTLQDEANTKEGFTNKRKKGRGDDDNKKAKRSHSLKL